MSRLARAAVVAALVTAPIALTATPASALCTAVPVGKTEVTYCSEPGYLCAGVGTPSVDAGACLHREGVECYVALPNGQLLACDI